MSNLKIIQKRKIWLTLSSILVILSIAAIAVWRLNFGIDFTGGSLLEVEFSDQRPTSAQVQEALADFGLNSLSIQATDNNGLILRFQEVSEQTHQEILEKINILSTSEELRFDAIGPAIGEELKRKSILAIIFVLIAIVLYIAWAFRKVSKPISSWKYGIVAIIALFHDVIITIGVFSILGKFYGIEVNTPFVAAILTVLGYSVNDTIVVFDRIRENLIKTSEDFETTVNNSINQTLRRSLYTSFTTLLVLVSIIVFGGATIRDFVLALSIGVFIGTYSSIFLASPILVVWEKIAKK